mmetsp:Transcript_2730/g.5975  ORF Transcript_2730/g.5975 Transcript_2730/m.5975 type:complete len:218 (-) Transcript_2730:368-1021(-)
MCSTLVSRATSLEDAHWLLRAWAQERWRCGSILLRGGDSLEQRRSRATATTVDRAPASSAGAAVRATATRRLQIIHLSIVDTVGDMHGPDLAALGKLIHSECGGRAQWRNGSRLLAEKQQQAGVELLLDSSCLILRPCVSRLEGVLNIQRCKVQGPEDHGHHEGDDENPRWPQDPIAHHKGSHASVREQHDCGNLTVWKRKRSCAKFHAIMESHHTV